METIGTVARKLGRTTVGPALTTSGFGFDSLSDESCERLLEKYAQGIADIESGRSNYACGGNSLRQVKKWHARLSAEIGSRT